MKKLTLFVTALCLLLQTSCSNTSTTKEGGLSSSKVTVKKDAAVRDSRELDAKTLALEEKLVELLKVELKNKNYQEFFVKYENYLLKEGVLKSKDGKGYLELLNGFSSDIYGGILPPSEMEDFKESDQMYLRGFVSAFDKVENEMKALPKKSPLKVYANIINDIRETGNVSPSKVFTTLTTSLDEKTLDKDFYQEYTLLLLFVVTR